MLGVCIFLIPGFQNISGILPFAYIFQAVTVLSLALGIRSSFSTIRDFPAIVLTPIITFWSIGPVSPTNSFGCQMYSQNNLIGVSFWHTWINLIISSIFGIGYTLQFLDYTEPDFWYGDGGKTKTIFEIGFLDDPYQVGFQCVIMLHLFSIISLVLLQFLDKCKKCCCLCCETHCFPITQVTVLDTENIEVELIELKNIKHQEKKPTSQNFVEKNFDVNEKNLRSKQTIFKNWIFYVDQYIAVGLIFLIIVSIVVTYFAMFGLSFGYSKTFCYAFYDI